MGNIVVSAQGFFSEMVEEGLHRKQMKVSAGTHGYLVNLLEYYMDARNLADDPPTLAEMYLKAADTSRPERKELLKKLGDRSLYISGFFGDSLSRSLVDVSYYAGMGGAAYGNLAESVQESEVASIYRVFSERFIDFVDVLTYISQKSLVQTDQNVLQLYDRYLRTGSEIAREKLSELGVLPVARDSSKTSRQN